MSLRVVFCGLLLICSIGIARGKCPQGWKEFKSGVKVKCFLIDSKAATLRQNQEMCESMDSTMVSIHSKEEEEFLKTITEKKPAGYWLGGEQVIKGTFDYEWKDATPFDYSDWKQSEPDCAADCCGIVWGHWGWVDTPCADSDKMSQLCQLVEADEVSSRRSAVEEDVQCNGGSNDTMRSEGGSNSTNDTMDLKLELQELKKELMEIKDALKEQTKCLQASVCK